MPVASEDCRTIFAGGATALPSVGKRLNQTRQQIYTYNDYYIVIIIAVILII